MKRTFLLLAAGAASTFASADALAAQRSDNSGFLLGAHVTSSSVGTTGRGSEVRSGPGAGIKLGYGFNDRIALYLGFDGAEIRNSGTGGGGDTFSAATADLGARISFGNRRQALRPYLAASTTGLALTENGLFGMDGEAQAIGSGLNVGIGAQYFFWRRLAADAGFHVTTGSFTEVKLDGTTTEIPGVSFQHGRLQLGLTWHP